MSSAKDKIGIVFNPLSGQFDMVKTFNPNRIVTNTYNQAGNKLKIYDVVSGLYLDLGPQVVTDNDGNVVVV
jgi:hypothetical protein